MKRENRKATYTMKVPIVFTFCADYGIEEEELYEIATKEAHRRLYENGYFDLLEKELDCIKEEVHKTREERLAERRAERLEFDILIGIGGLRK